MTYLEALNRLQEIADLIVTLDSEDEYEGFIVEQLIQEATDLQEELGITEFDYEFVPKQKEINL